MKKLFVLLFLLFGGYSWASAPSSSFTYIPGTTIIASQVQTNENNIYSYLQSGVDTYKSGSITQASISPTAGILYSQLNLSGGILPGDFNTTTTTSIYQLENIIVPNGGNITDNGTFNLGTSHQGDLFYDNGSSIIRLPSSASSQNEFLQSGGLNANPQFTTESIYNFAKGSFTTQTSITLTGLIPGVKYKLFLNLLQNVSAGALQLTFNGDSGNNYTTDIGGFTNNSSPSFESSASAFIYLVPNATIDASTNGQQEILFQTTIGNNNHVITSSSGNFVVSGHKYAAIGSGSYLGSSSLTSVTVTTSAGTITGTYSLYQMS